MYGHFDKQPYMGVWSEGFGPTTPVIKNERLYGRGSLMMAMLFLVQV